MRTGCVQRLRVPRAQAAGQRGGWVLAAAVAGSVLACPCALGERSRSCTDCHRFEAALSHPVDIRASMAIPAQLPLENGRVTCVTCHEAGPGHPDGSERVLLRTGATGSGLCAQCHQPKSDRSGSHATGIAMRAHLKTGPDADSWTEQESRSCVECHDGAMAGDPGIPGIGGAGQGHPVGVKYGSHVQRPSAGGALVNVAALDPRLRLANQQVTCSTCHSPYSRQPRMLVMSNLRSKLCMSCHVE
jgi:predicted CXXCH cytochrome family protein